METIYPIAIPNISILGDLVTFKAGPFRYFKVPRLMGTINQSWKIKIGHFFTPTLRVSHLILLVLTCFVPGVYLFADGGNRPLSR
jgi:hypothetical protein